MGRLQELFGERTVLFDGAMGTMLYDRGVFINRCYDELNLSQPELVRSIHEEYLQAGAEIIESNTFGANSFRLSHFGLQDKVFAINRAGAQLARQAVAQLADKQAGEAWVAGSIGPLGVLLEPLGKTSLDEARSAFTEQIKGLVAGGVDMLVVETISALNEAEQALLAAADAAPGVPVLALVTVDEEANCLDGATCETAAAKLTAWGADAIGVNCSAGPATVLTAIERMAAATSLPLVVMPNAGMPRAIEGRNIYLCSPEYMANFAKKFLKAGVQFLGGCCGTTPNHIRAMKSAMRAVLAQKAPVKAGSREPIITETPPAPLAERSKIGRLVANGEFVTLVEIVPPRGNLRGEGAGRREAAGEARRPCDQRAGFAAGLGAHERAEPVHPDPAAGRHRDGAALHLPRPQCAEHPERSAGCFVDRAEEHPVPDGRSAEAGELSRRNGGVRCGRDRPGEHRATG